MGHNAAAFWAVFGWLIVAFSFGFSCGKAHQKTKMNRS